MPGTFSKIYIHLTFAVKGRASLIHPQWEEELFKYIAGIVRNKGQKLLAINGMPDHLHLLVSLQPSCCISDLVREIKKSSNEFIKVRGFVRSTFAWQEGYAAISVGYSSLAAVVNYIEKQKEHHSDQSFKDEYHRMLKESEIEFDAKYLFDWIDLPSN